MYDLNEEEKFLWTAAVLLSLTGSSTATSEKAKLAKNVAIIHNACDIANEFIQMLRARKLYE